MSSPQSWERTGCAREVHTPDKHEQQLTPLRTHQTKITRTNTTTNNDCHHIDNLTLHKAIELAKNIKKIMSSYSRATINFCNMLNNSKKKQMYVFFFEHCSSFPQTPLLQSFEASSLLGVFAGSNEINTFVMPRRYRGRSCGRTRLSWNYQSGEVLGSAEGLIPFFGQTWLTFIGPLIM